jgi:hypothetical protein
MTLIDYLLIIALLTAGLYALYSALNWPRRTGETRREKGRAPAGGSARAKAPRQNGVAHAFSRYDLFTRKGRSPRFMAGRRGRNHIVAAARLKSFTPNFSSRKRTL